MKIIGAEEDQPHVEDTTDTAKESTDKSADSAIQKNLVLLNTERKLQRNILEHSGK